MAAKKPKVISFEYIERDKSISLGVPEKVVVQKGNWRDGGCHLKFSTSESDIGLKVRFALYLFAEDVNEVTRKMWKAYLKTEPDRAREDLRRLLEEFGKL